jgi:hypothetical protein
MTLALRPTFRPGLLAAPLELFVCWALAHGAESLTSGATGPYVAKQSQATAQGHETYVGVVTQRPICIATRGSDGTANLTHLGHAGREVGA